MKVSIIIPTYNEEKVIKDCLDSLLLQSYKDLEIIVVDDGSSDSTKDIVSKFSVKLESQTHLGPAKARNLGASKSSGEILVFVDADMTFDPDFIKNLTKPIRDNKTKGTFSKDEFVSNAKNIWSRCWNINKNLPLNKMHPVSYPDTQEVFRAILKSEFIKAGGFDSIGYIDDYTLFKKLGYMATVAPDAVFYHRNPESLNEVFIQAKWIGKNEFVNRKIKNQNLMRIIALVRFSILFSLIFGLYKAIKSNTPFFLIFKIIYDFATKLSLINSFFSKNLYK